MSYTQTKTKDGHQVTQSDQMRQELCATDSQRAVKGNSITSTGGSSSESVSEKKEGVYGSSYEIVGSQWMAKMHPGEDADKYQTKLVAMRSQPDTVPDTDLLTPPTEALKPAPNLLSCISCPKASELEDMAPKVPLTPMNAITTELANLGIKIAALVSGCSMETAKQMAKMQANHSKNVVKKNIEEKKKMYEKMPTLSKEAFKKNFEKAFAPKDGKSSFENLMSGVGTAVQLASNPMSLVSMCMSPSTENAPKKEFYDKDKVQEQIPEMVEKVRKAEARMS